MNNLEWLMATHDDDSKAQSKTEPNLSEQSESLSGETDSREKLEADVRKRYMYTVSTAMWPPSANKHADMVSVSIETVLEWLDRQAAITERECREYEDELRKQHHRRLHATRCAIAKAGGTWTEDDDGAVAVVFAPDVDKLKAERDKLREELRVEREAVEACEGCGKVDDLQAKLDSLKRAVSDVGGMWMEEGGTVTAAFATDADELREEISEIQSQLQAAHAKNRALKAHIAKMQDGRHGWHVKAKELQERNDVQHVTIERLVERNNELQERVDDLEDELDETASARDQWRKAAGDVHDMWEQAATERDGYRTKLGRAIDLAGEIRRIAE